LLVVTLPEEGRVRGTKIMWTTIVDNDCG
jgi:hypothetical protein